MKKVFIAALLIASLASCKKSKTGATATETPAAAPEKASLLAPASNSTCVIGRVTSSTETAVTLTWNSAANASSYELYLKNLLTGTISSQSTSAVQLEITLLRNTPYSWYVVSKSSKNAATAQSDTWKFYNAGIASSSYAPFPADLLLPANEQNVSATAGKIVLDWSGADVDNDIVGYDVYMGTSTASQALIKANQVESILTDVTVTVGTTYYWKITTKDSKGNTSSSEVYSFKVI